MAKGKATVNQIKTNSGIGFRMIIPKKIVDELKIKDKETFLQKLVDGHIEMERAIKGEDNTVSIEQWKNGTSITTRTYIVADIASILKLKKGDIMLFKTEEEKIIIQKF